MAAEEQTCESAVHRLFTDAGCVARALGRRGEARAVARDLLAIEPSFRVSTFISWYPLQRKDDLARLEAGLLAAGLPN